MAYNRWLSSQYSYNPGYDLMHYGRKGMRWGKHIFGLPEITLNGGGGIVDPEELEKLLKEGKITLDEFKARANKILQDDIAANKEGIAQVQERIDKMVQWAKSIAKQDIEVNKEGIRQVAERKGVKKALDTYENFKARDGSDKKPESSNKKPLDSTVVDRIDPFGYHRQSDIYYDRGYKKWMRDKTETKKRKMIEGRFKTDPNTGDAKFYERASAEVEAAENRSRTNSKIQDRKGQESRDRKENLERKRAERASAPRKVSKNSNQNVASSKGDYSLEDVVRLAFSSTKSSSSPSAPSAAKPKSTSPKQQSSAPPKSEPHSLTPKQKKVYETIGKFLNFTISLNPSYRMTK